MHSPEFKRINREIEAGDARRRRADRIASIFSYFKAPGFALGFALGAAAGAAGVTLIIIAYCWITLP